MTTLRDFYELGERVKDVKVLAEFVDRNLDVPGQELVEVYPEDWAPFPNRFFGEIFLKNEIIPSVLHELRTTGWGDGLSICIVFGGIFAEK